MNGGHYGNNRYSSQNMKNSYFEDDEEQIDDGDVGLEVADENQIDPTCMMTAKGQLNTEQCFSDSAPDTLS